MNLPSVDGSKLDTTSLRKYCSLILSGSCLVVVPFRRRSVQKFTLLSGLDVVLIVGRISGVLFSLNLRN